MHLEGKIHQGFLKLRTEIDTLKIRLEIVQQKIDKERELNKHLPITQNENNRSEVKVEKPAVIEKIEEKEPKERI